MKTQEEFEEQIYSIPMWVKTPQDLQKFTAHIYYRLVQADDMLKLMRSLIRQKDEKLADDISEKTGEIYEDYEFYYNNPTFDKMKYFADHQIEINVK